MVAGTCLSVTLYVHTLPVLLWVVGWRTGVQFVAVGGVITTSVHIHPVLFWHSDVLAVLFIGVKLLECKADHSPLSSSKLRKFYMCTSTHHMCPHGMVPRDIFAVTMCGEGNRHVNTIT